MKNLKLYGPFLWMQFSYLKATEPLYLFLLPFSSQEFLVLI